MFFNKTRREKRKQEHKVLLPCDCCCRRMRQRKGNKTIITVCLQIIYCLSYCYGFLKINSMQKSKKTFRSFIHSRSRPKCLIQFFLTLIFQNKQETFLLIRKLKSSSCVFCFVSMRIEVKYRISHASFSFTQKVPRGEKFTHQEIAPTWPSFSFRISQASSICGAKMRWRISSYLEHYMLCIFDYPRLHD